MGDFAQQYYQGNYEQAIQAADQFNESDESYLESIIYKSLCYYRLGDIENALKYANFAYEKALELNDIISEIGARYAKSRILERKGEFDSALEILEFRIPELKSDHQEKYGDKLSIWIGYSIASRGFVHLRLNQFDISLTQFFEALKISKKILHKPLMAYILNNLGILFDFKGEIQKSQGYYEQGLALNKEIGNNIGVFYIRNNIGNLQIKKGELEAANKTFNQNLEFLQNHNTRNLSLWRVTYTNLGRIAHIGSYHDKAKEYYKKSSEITREIKDDPALAYDLFKLIIISIETDQIEDAKQYLSELNGVRVRTKDPNVEIDYQISNAFISKSIKRLEGFGKSIEIFENLVNQEIENFETRFFILFELCKLLILSYEVIPSEDTLDQINNHLSEIIKLSEIQNTYPVLIDTLIIKARLNLAMHNLADSQELLELASQMAMEKDLKMYISKINEEIERLNKNLIQWVEKETMTKRIQNLDLLEYLDSISKMIK